MFERVVITLRDISFSSLLGLKGLKRVKRILIAKKRISEQTYLVCFFFGPNNVPLIQDGELNRSTPALRSKFQLNKKTCGLQAGVNCKRPVS